MLSASMEGGELRAMTDLGASHCDWLTEELIFGWVTMKEGQNYYLMNDTTCEYEVVRPDILTRNGHCNFTQDGTWMLTDEYPDDNSQQALFLWHMAKSTVWIWGATIRRCRSVARSAVTCIPAGAATSAWSASTRSMKAVGRST